MTIELFARRVGAALAVSGFGLFIAAALFWSTAGDGGSVVHSIHTVVGSAVAVLGLVLIGIGLAISTAIPPRHLQSDVDDARGSDHGTSP